MPNLNKDQQNLEEEMKKTSCINICRYCKSFKKTSPEWLEELRKIILTTELIELPRKFKELLKNVKN